MTRYRAERVVAGGQVLTDAWIDIDGDRIAAVGTGSAAGGGDLCDLGAAIVVPGFVDLHCHGGAGASYTSGDIDEIAAAAAFHRRHGTTFTLASLVTDDLAELRGQLGVLREATERSVVGGAHLEGPFLSRERCGAHVPSLLRDPDPDSIAQLLREGGSALRMVTLAPERPGGLEAVRQVVAAGVIAAVGHTDADFEVVLQAIAAGARVATHLGNAMRPLHQRRPGPLPALLGSTGVVCELIVDGFHLHPGFVDFVARTVSAQRAALITDAVAAAGMPDGEYQTGLLSVTVRNGMVHLTHGDSIAGSTLTLDAAFRRAITECGFSLLDAVAASSTTPAGVLGRPDLGKIEPGGRADLVVFDQQYLLQGVLAGGEWVDSRVPELVQPA